MVYHNKKLPLFPKVETLHTAVAWYHFSTFLCCVFVFVTYLWLQILVWHCDRHVWPPKLFVSGGHMWCALCMLSVETVGPFNFRAAKLCTKVISKRLISPICNGFFWPIMSHIWVTQKKDFHDLQEKSLTFKKVSIFSDWKIDVGGVLPWGGGMCIEIHLQSSWLTAGSI